MRNNVSSLALVVYKLCFFFISIPIFVDFGDGGLFLIHVEDYSIWDRPSIPMPVGAIALLTALAFGFLVNIVSPGSMAATFPPIKLVIFLAYFLVFFGAYALFVSGLSPARFVQVVLPAIALACLSFPKRGKDRTDVLRFYVLGAGVWFFLHFFSIILEAENFLSPHDRSEFSSFYGYLVYQSLVSYPGVIAILLYFIAWVTFRQLTSSLASREGQWFTLLCFGLLVVLMYMGFAAGRRAFVLEIASGLAIVSASFFVYGMKFRYTKKAHLLFSLLFFVFLVASFLAYFQTDLSNRLVSSVDTGSFDSGRIEILGRAMSFFYHNTSVLFFGAGGSDAPGFHNFFLDQIYRVGALGLAVVYSITYILLRRVYRSFGNGSVLTYGKAVFLIMIFSSFFLQSMINASVSQPYYLINLVVVLMLLVFSDFPRSSTSY